MAKTAEEKKISRTSARGVKRSEKSTAPWKAGREGRGQEREKVQQTSEVHGGRRVRVHRTSDRRRGSSTAVRGVILIRSARPLIPIAADADRKCRRKVWSAES